MKRGIVMEILKVSAKSSPNSVAGAIAGIIRDNGSVEIQVVGAGATNQAVKATAIATSSIFFFMFLPPSFSYRTAYPEGIPPPAVLPQRPWQHTYREGSGYRRIHSPAAG